MALNTEIDFSKKPIQNKRGYGIDFTVETYSAIIKDIQNSIKGSTLEVNDNLVLENTNNTTTSVAIYGVNVITTSTSSDRACKLPIAQTGRSTVFINNSTLPILVFPSAVGGEINGVVNGFAVIPNDGSAYTFYCIENPLPGAWTWSPPATAQYDSGEIICDTTSGIGSASNFNVSVSNNYTEPYIGAGSPSTGWVFACQTRPLLDTPLPNLLPYSAGDTGGISGPALSAGIMNITKIKIYTNAHVGGSGIYAGMAVSSGFSVYDSSISPSNFITNGPYISPFKFGWPVQYILSGNGRKHINCWRSFRICTYCLFLFSKCEFAQIRDTYSITTSFNCRR